MRVALVCPYSLSAPGGVQGQVLALGRALRAAGHQAMSVGPWDDRSSNPQLAAGAVVGVGRSVGVPANGSVARLALSPMAAVRTVAALGRFQPDVVHVHEPLAPGPTWAALARPEPKVGTFHRAGAVTARALLEMPARLLAGRLLVRTAVSASARSTAVALAGGEYEMIGNGVELERFARAQPWPTESPTILFVGRHEARKGLDVLLEAFARLPPGVDARLWVAGEGPRSGRLRQAHRHQGGVEWLGALDDTQLASRLAGAHVLCAPALGAESFGVVLVEAMAARTTVVASDIPGYAAVVGSHGVLVRPGDVGALAVALTTVLDDAGAGRGSASPSSLDAAAAHAAQWSMVAVAERYLVAYEQALAMGELAGGS